MMNHQSTRIFKLKNLSVAAMFRSAGIGSSPAKWQRSTNFQWQRSTDFQHNGKSVEGIGSRDGLKKMAILNIHGHYGAAITKKECRKSPSHENSCVGYLGARTATGSMTKLRHLVAIQEGGRGWSKALATVPPYVTEAIRPISSPYLLTLYSEECMHGGTENTNESFHIVIWQRCPKTTFCGRSRVELAVAHATVVFNNGELGRNDILTELNMQASVYATQCLDSFRKLDSRQFQNLQSFCAWNQGSKTTKKAANSGWRRTWHGYWAILLVWGSWID